MEEALPAEGLLLESEDRAILALENDTIVGHTCKVVVLGQGAPGADSLREAVAARLERVPLLSARLGGTEDQPAWVHDAAFDPARHVVDAPMEAPVDGTGLRREVARLFEHHLPRDRPLWHIARVPLAEGGAALIWRIHHALADGTAAMRYAGEVLFDAEPGAPAGRRAGNVDDRRRRAHLGRFVAREFARSVHRPPFDGRIGRRREVAFCSTRLDSLHDAAKRLAGATLNDAVLSVLAGAIRRWLEQTHGRLGPLRGKVPVSLHSEGDDASNRDSFFTVALPLEDADPAHRLRAVCAATGVRKAEHDAEEMEALLRHLAEASPALERLCERVERSPRDFALNVSNVPGPRTPVTIQGAAVRSLYSLAEIGERHALRVAVVSAGGQLGFGFCADPGIVHRLEAMAEGVEQEAAALVARA